MLRSPVPGESTQYWGAQCLGCLLPSGGALGRDAHYWDARCLKECLVPGAHTLAATRMLGGDVWCQEAQHWDTRYLRGCSISVCPCFVVLTWYRDAPCLEWWGLIPGIPAAWCQGRDALYSVLGCSVPRGNAQYQDARRPGRCLVMGCLVPGGCTAPGYPIPGRSVPGGRTVPGHPAPREDTQCPGGCSALGRRARQPRGTVLTAALEALPAASPDEVPAEVAPGVEPAAPGLEAMPGARCRRRPGLGPRSGAVPAGRADAQRVGSLQAAPARPRLGLQLPQLDQLHGPGRCAAAAGRGPDREWPPRGGN